MELTTNQIKQANALIQKYGFCTLETQEKLCKAGFFKVVKPVFSIRILKSNDTQVELCLSETEDILGIFHKLPMPQLHDVWAALPDHIMIDNIFYCAKEYTMDMIGVWKMKYRDTKTNLTKIQIPLSISHVETASLFWLKLNQSGLLPEN